MMIRMLRSEQHVCCQADNGLAAVSEVTRSLMHLLSEDKQAIPSGTDGSSVKIPSVTGFDIVLIDGR